MSQQNIINTLKAGLDLLPSKQTTHELLHCEPGPPSGTTYRTGGGGVGELHFEAHWLVWGILNMRRKRRLIALNTPTDLSPERCWLSISRACLRPHLWTWGQRQISSIACKFNFTPFFTRQQISSTIRKSDSFALYSSRSLFWKVINDLQMFGLLMNKSGLAEPEGRGCWQAARF